MPLLSSLAQDLRLAVRSFRHSLLFNLLVIFTIASGIGISTAMFSIVDRVLFRSLPYPQASQLVSVGISAPIDGNEFMLGHAYVNWRNRETPFTSFTSMRPGGNCALGDQNPIQVRCISVESNFLPTLGIHPILGRNFSGEEDRPHAPHVALISYAIWRARFGGNPVAIGRTIRLDYQAFRIVGVLPASFEMPQLGEADVLVPEQLDITAQLRSPTGAFLRCFARLKSGVSLNRAREAMQPLYRSSLQDVPPMLRGEVHFVLRSLRDRQIHDVRLASWLLLAAAVALLSIACSNVANLMMGRMLRRRRESAMRAALGASHFRLLQASLVENLVLSLLGGLSGIAIAWALLRLLVSISPHAIVRLEQARLDLRVLLFTLLTSVFVALLFGVSSAFERPRAEALVGWHVVGVRRAVARDSLVAVQICISLVLLTGASLFTRSLLKLESQQLGLQTEHVLTATLEINAHRYAQPAAQAAFYRELEEKLAAIPGVSTLALSDSIPPAGGYQARPFSNIRIAGHPSVPEQGGLVVFRRVTPSYFAALGIPLIRGRAFRESDRSSSNAPVILSAGLAQKLFGNENPIGQQLSLDVDANDRPLWSTILGVAADVKNNGLDSPAGPEYYRLRTWNSEQLGHTAVAILHTFLPAGRFAPFVRKQIAAIDPMLPVTIQSLPDRVSRLGERPRFIVFLLSSFAAFGLLLAAVGLYAVISSALVHQTREIGVRMALGATPSRVISFVLGPAMRSVIIGLLCGLMASLALSRFIRSLLFETSPQDPSSFAIASALLLLASVLAVLIPTARASRVQPAISLRHE
jgi:putative ABC transport system permease protein